MSWSGYPEEAPELMAESDVEARDYHEQQQLEEEWCAMQAARDPAAELVDALKQIGLVAETARGPDATARQRYDALIDINYRVQRALAGVVPPACAKEFPF